MEKNKGLRGQGVYKMTQVFSEKMKWGKNAYDVRDYDPFIAFCKKKKKKPN